MKSILVVLLVLAAQSSNGGYEPCGGEGVLKERVTCRRLTPSTNGIDTRVIAELYAKDADIDCEAVVRIVRFGKPLRRPELTNYRSTLPEVTHLAATGGDAIVQQWFGDKELNNLFTYRYEWRRYGGFGRVQFDKGPALELYCVPR